MSENSTEGRVVNGKKEGYWVTYYANGNKRSEGAYRAGKKHGKWILYYQNGNKKSEASFRDGLYEGWYVCYYENGNKKWEGPYAPHTGKSTDGRKEGVWKCYSEKDGKTVWRIITYKRGARAKPDEHPLGLCSNCGQPLQHADECVHCGWTLSKR